MLLHITQNEYMLVKCIHLLLVSLCVLLQEFLKGADQVRLQNAKLQQDAGSAALKFMDCLFSTEEMVNGNPSGVTRSKDTARQRTIKQLDPEKMRYINSKFIGL